MWTGVLTRFPSELRLVGVFKTSPCPPSPDSKFISPSEPKVSFPLPASSLEPRSWPAVLPRSPSIEPTLRADSEQITSKMPLTGHCLCKAVTYKVDVDEPILTGYDHCDDCQRQSGSTYCE